MTHCTKPKGMLSSDVVYLSKLRPLMMSGPKVLVTEAPALTNSESATQRYVLGSRNISMICRHLNSRVPMPIWLARSRSIAFSLSSSERKRADGMSLSSFQYTIGAVTTVTRPTKRKMLLVRGLALILLNLFLILSFP